MELIDFDARFNDALNDWMEKNRKKFKRPEDMEDAAPEFYMEWLKHPPTGWAAPPPARILSVMPTRMSW